MNWHKHHINNIDDNPIDEIYTILDYGEEDGFAKKFSIVYNYPLGEKWQTLVKEPNYYVVFVANGNYSDNDDYLGYEFEHPSMIQVFDSENKAKEYIEQFQIPFYMSGYLESHILEKEEVKNTINKRKVV